MLGSRSVLFRQKHLGHLSVALEHYLTTSYLHISEHFPTHKEPSFSLRCDSGRGRVMTEADPAGECSGYVAWIFSVSVCPETLR
jgi:hypothetical protein